VSWLPFYHDMGLVGTLLTPITCQASVDYLATESFARRPLQWLRLMSENKGTITYSPTFGYDICARRIKESALENLNLSQWRVAGIGAEMIRPDVMEHFLSVFQKAGFKPTTFMPSYGLAECTLAVSFMPENTGIVTDKVDERILSGEVSLARANGHINGEGGPERYRDVVNCGVPLPEYEVEIRDAAQNAMDEHDIGRIFLRGVSVMQGYFNDEQATKDVLSDDGWLDTGDMGYMLDGSIYIVGRAKDMIIVNGRNHWPQDIEWSVEQLAGIRSGDIAAISLPGDDDEEVPTVLVQCRLRDQDERRAFVEQIKTKILDDTGIQCRIELIPPKTLPRTSSGKLSRVKARQQFLTGDFEALAV
ncbi:MAG: AMP-binding protein, partial [Sphingomonadales bacterium]|nr:AMP-binding protein [Sphingomonadales bacterium]